MQTGFGAGIMWGTPLTDATGAAIATPSPVLFGILQDVSIDISFDVKELYGQNQFPFAVGRGKGKISGKAKAAQVFGLLYNSLFFGQTLSSGIFNDVYNTTSKNVPTTPYQITVSSAADSSTNIQIPNSGTFAGDLGVFVASTGAMMTRAASAVAGVSYSLSSNTYTFASGDSGVGMLINYTYTATSTVAKNSTVSSLPMGYAPTFQTDLMVPYSGKQLTLSLLQCVATKLTIPTKLDDFLIPEFDFSAFANAGGQVMKWGTSE